MLDQLESLAADLGLPFDFGSMAELNVLADNHRDGQLLFHQGLLEYDASVPQGGGFERTHQLTLFVLTPSALADTRADKRANQRILQPIAEQVISSLDALTMRPFRMRVSMFQTLNLTDRNLDGIKLTGSLTLTELPQC